MQAMKVEHSIEALTDGVVEKVMFSVGDEVAEGAQLLRFLPKAVSRGQLTQLFQKQVSNQRVPRLNGAGSEISDAGFPQNILDPHPPHRRRRAKHAVNQMNSLDD
jgi:multidrug efflux pump subunit AcrA (membrane-fusion protein)